MSHKNICKIGSENSFDFLESFKDWDKVELIIHQGAITKTTEKNIDIIYKYNVYFSIKLFEKAIKYKIPIKYASSASVYGNQTNIINPLNYYSISKVIIDYWVMDHIDEFKQVQDLDTLMYMVREESKGDKASAIQNLQTKLEIQNLNLFKGSENFLETLFM